MLHSFLDLALKSEQVLGKIEKLVFDVVHLPRVSMLVALTLFFSIFKDATNSDF